MVNEKVSTIGCCLLQAGGKFFFFGLGHVIWGFVMMSRKWTCWDRLGGPRRAVNNTYPER